MKKELIREPDKKGEVFRKSCLLETYLQKNSRQLSIIKDEMIRLGLPDKEIASILSLPETFIRDLQPESRLEKEKD